MTAAFKRILLVEDEIGYQELMGTILSGLFEVTTCGTAEEALDKINTERFDLIISDINMFGMTGFEVLNTIKQRGLSETCPVILCSSQFDPATKEKAMSMGAAGFIPKPYEFQMVVSLIRALLQTAE